MWGPVLDGLCNTSWSFKGSLGEHLHVANGSSSKWEGQLTRRIVVPAIPTTLPPSSCVSDGWKGALFGGTQFWGHLPHPFLHWAHPRAWYPCYPTVVFSSCTEKNGKPLILIQIAEFGWKQKRCNNIFIVQTGGELQMFFFPTEDTNRKWPQLSQQLWLS